MPPLTLLLAGDVMTGRGIDQVLAHPGAPALYEAKVHDARDYVRLAERVHGPIARPLTPGALWGDALAAMDRVRPRWRIANLETAISTQGLPWPGKAVHYRMHPDNIGALSAAGLHCCVLANNHVLDWGRPGLAQTLQVLHAAGLQTAGAGEDGAAARAPVILPLDDGRRLLVFGCATRDSGVPAGWAAAPRRPGIALLPDLSEASARNLAEHAARHRHGDGLVIVSIHWGGNWGPQVPEAHRRFARRLIDLGAADIVHGHSSHHPLPIEVYHGRLILYGCGDLINDYEGIGPNGDLRSDVGCLYFPTLHAETGRLQRLEIVPLQLQGFRLRAADAPARQAVQRLIVGADAAHGIGLQPLGEAGWQLVWPPEPAAAA